MTQLAGSLSDVDLLPLVRFLTALGTSGDLRISYERWCGQLVFAGGHIVSAACGPERGLQALDAIVLTLSDGEFTYTSDAAPIEPDGSQSPDLRLSPDELEARLAHVRTVTGPGAVRLTLAAIPEVVATPDEIASERLVLDPEAIQTLLTIDGQRRVDEIVGDRGIASVFGQLRRLLASGHIRLKAQAAEPASRLALPEPGLTTHMGDHRRSTDRHGTAERRSGPVSSAQLEEFRRPPPLPMDGRPASLSGVGAIDPTEPGAPIAEPQASTERMRSHRWFLGVLMAVLLAECTAAFWRPEVAFGIDLTILLALLLRSSSGPTRDRSLLVALTVVPLVRVVTLTLPVGSHSEPVAYVLISLPLAAAGGVAARVLRLSRADLGLQLGNVPQQLAIGLLGAPIAIVQMLVLRPSPIVDRLSGGTWVPGTFALLFAGLVEEFLFRGVLQAPAYYRFSGRGLVYVSALVAALAVGYSSAAELFIVFALSLAFALIVARTGSLLGVAIAHGFANVGAYFILPLLVGTLGQAIGPLVPTSEPALTPTAQAGLSATPSAAAVGLQSEPVSTAISTPQAQITGNATIPAQLRTVLDERFDSPVNAWPDNPDGTARRMYGAYHLRAQQPGRFVAVGAPVPLPLSAVTVTAIFRKVGGPSGGGYGLILRDQGPPPRDGLNQSGRYYVLEAGDRGELGIWRRTGNDWVELVPWTPSPAVQPGGAVNKVTARASGSQLTLSVNDVLAASATDATLANGGVGVFVGGDLNEVRLEQFIVQSGT